MIVIIIIILLFTQARVSECKFKVNPV